MKDRHVLVAAWALWVTLVAVCAPMAALAEGATTQTRVLQEYGLGGWNCSAVSPDNKRVVTGGEGGAFLWNIETASIMRRYYLPGYSIYSVAFSPDGTRLLTGGSYFAPSENTNEYWSSGGHSPACFIWDVETGKVALSFPVTGECMPCAFSPDGRYVLTAGDSGEECFLQLWDAQSGAEIRTFSYPDDDGVSSIAFSPDGKRLVAGVYRVFGLFTPSEHRIRMWNVETGDLSWSYLWDNADEINVTFSPAGDKVLACTTKGESYPWYTEGKLIYTSWGFCNRTFYIGPDWCGQVAFPDPAKYLTVCGGEIDTWDAATGSRKKRLITNADDLVFSPDGTKALADKGLWDIAGETSRTVVRGNFCGSSAAVLTPDASRLLTVNKTTELWDIASGGVIYTFPTSEADFWDNAAFSPNGKRLLRLGSRTYTSLMDMWDMETLQPMWSSDQTGSLGVFLPDGASFLAVDYWGAGRLWDVETGTSRPLFVCPESDWVRCVAVSPDGRYAVTAGGDWDVWEPVYNAVARLWDIQTGEMKRVFEGHTQQITAVAFSPDGSQLLTGAWDYTARLWDVNTGEEIRRFTGRDSLVSAVGFSPDGALVIIGSEDNAARVWDIATSQVVRVLPGHSSPVLSAAFSPDGASIMTATCGGTAQIWELHPPRAIIVAGGGDFVGNGIAWQTDDLGAYAYMTLARRGYEAKDILYLTSFGPSDPTSPTLPFKDADSDGLNDVDGWANLDTVREAVTGAFAQGAGRLLILMIDHGHRTQSFMTFRINPTQVLPATVLDGWLDDLQTSHPVGVTLVVDSCYSGQIVEDCRLTTTELTGGAGWHGSPGHNPAGLAGRTRIVIASTQKDKEAVFLPPPDLTSFMYSFLSSAYMGNSMGEAWRAGSRFFQEFPVANQTPQLDDGTATPGGAASTARADKEFFGATWAYGVQSTQDVNDFFPVFDSWTTHTLVSPGDPVTLRAKMLWGQNPRELVAVIRPPAPEVVSGEPVTNLPHLYLQRQSYATTSPLYRVWEVTTHTVFSAKGDYTVSFSARFDYERVSNPVFGHVVISEGLDPDQTPIRAILAVDNTTDTALAQCLRYLGPYAYSVYLDRFKDTRGYSHPDWIEYLINPSWDAQEDDPPSAANVLDAIAAVPPDTGRLYIHLIGGAGSFDALLPPSDATREYLLGRPSSVLANPSASDVNADNRLDIGDVVYAVNGRSLSLDAALDTLQARQNCLVVLVVDTPRAGDFLAHCHATGAQRRVILTSGRSGDSAFFLPSPTLTSFSYKFLSSAYQGANLKEAFGAADRFFNAFLRYFVKDRIYPQLDDNGDGVYNAIADGALARAVYLGRRYAFAGSEGAGLPFILDVTTTQTAEPLAPVTYTARLIEGVEPTSVVAQLVKVDAVCSTQTITQLPEVAFARDAPTSWTWSTTFAAPATTGTYTLAIYAAYPDTPHGKLSEPAFSALTVGPPPLAASLKNTLAGPSSPPGRRDRTRPGERIRQ